MIEIFPGSSLDNSILTSVLLGVLVLWLFEETLGWNFTGLVVPGYLASVLAFEPMVAGVIVAEAALTWLVFGAISDGVPSWFPWTPLFGRDRFFGLLLTSVAVRLLCEGAADPLWERYAGEHASSLHSMGLVVVPLTANAIWRTGLAAGVLRLGVPTLLTWLILDGLLLRYTNLNLAGFTLTSENLARDFVSSPRSYMLLLCGAWVGSTVNLRWGWDFGGLIVPGLLALVWTEPHRVVSTVAEAIAIAILYRLAVRLPYLAKVNLTGARPLVLGFVIGYGVRYLVAVGAAGLVEGVSPPDLFGFGYLLPTMIALRAIKHGDLVRPILPALISSFGGFVVGTAFGTALAVLAPAAPEAPTPARADRSRDAYEWTVASTYATPRGGLVQLPGSTSRVISVQTGVPGALGAGWAVAVALDAGALHVCPDPAACESSRRDRSGDGAWIAVDPGPSPQIEIPADADAAVLVDLAPLLPEVPTTAGEGWRVVLDQATLMRLASAVGQAPAPLEAVADLAPAPDRVASRPELRRFDAELLAPLFAWFETGSRPALALAAGEARRTGWTISVDPSGEVAVVHGPGARAVLRRRGEPLLVQARTVDLQPTAGAAAAALAEAWSARAAVGRASLAVPDTDDLHTQAALLSVRLVEALGSDARVVGVDLLPSGSPSPAPVVLSIGRPLGPGMAAPRVAEDAAAWFAARQLAVGWYDGRAAHASLADPGEPLRAAARANAGEEAYVTVYLRRDMAAALTRGDERAE